MSNYKYVLARELHGLTAYPESGKVVLSEETSQKDLIFLHQIGFKGVERIELVEEKPKKKKGK